MPTLHDDLPLFARATDPETSHQAASVARESAQGQRNRCLTILEAYGAMTAAEIDQAAGWRWTTANRRMKELERMGLVVRTHTKRAVLGHGPAEVWAAA